MKYFITWFLNLFTSNKEKQPHTKPDKVKKKPELTQNEYKIENEIKPTENQPEFDEEEHQARIKELGEQGERKSNFYALPITAYGKQLRNLYIPLGNGETTEIDTIVISVSGIYVIETKNYSGKIYGKQEYLKWTAYYSHNKKFTFYNPIRQNENHIKALKKHLSQVNENLFFSIITFSDDCKLDNVISDKKNTIVIHQTEMKDQFKQLLKQNEGVLSREQVNTIYNMLKEFTDVTEETKIKHIENINRKYKAINKKNTPFPKEESVNINFSMNKT